MISNTIEQTVTTPAFTNSLLNVGSQKSGPPIINNMDAIEHIHDDFINC